MSEQDLLDLAPKMFKVPEESFDLELQQNTQILFSPFLHQLTPANIWFMHVMSSDMWLHSGLVHL